MALAWALCSGAQGRSSRVAFADTGLSEAPPATSVLIINDAEEEPWPCQQVNFADQTGQTLDLRLLVG